MQQAGNRTLLQGRFNLRESNDDAARLAGHGERIERRALKHALGLGGEVGWKVDLAPKRPGEGLPPDPLGKVGAGRRDPHPATGKLALDVGNQEAVGSNDEPDQLVDRLRRPRYDAMPRAFGPHTRTVVELAIVDVRKHLSRDGPPEITPAPQPARLQLLRSPAAGGRPR